MLYCFSGVNRFAISSEINRRQEGFVSKFGQQNIHKYTETNWNTNEIISNISAEDFFGIKKFVVINFVPSGAKSEIKSKFISPIEDFISDHLESIIQNENIIILTSTNPDKRKSLYKKLQKIEKNTNFSLKSFDEITLTTAKKYVKELIGHIASDDLISSFIQRLGKDQGRLYNESQKLIQISKFYKKNEITEKTIESVSCATIDDNVFEIMDSISSGNIDDAISKVDNLQKIGTDRNMFRGGFAYSLRSFIMIGDCISGDVDLKQTGLPPFAVSKYSRHPKISQIGKLSENIFCNIVDIEKKVKIGKFPQESFRVGVKSAIYQASCGFDF